MSKRILAAIVLAMLVGCGSEKPPAAPPGAGVEAADLPPAQVHKVLEGLHSDNPRTQYAALDMLSKLPTVAQTYREHVQRLQKESKDDRVRKKAAALLSSLEERSVTK